MVDHIKIRKANGTWVVRAGGAVLAESSNAWEVTEGSTAPVIYFPRDDIAMAFLDASPQTSHSATLGQASFYSIETKSQTLTNAAWSYEDPTEGMGSIKNLIAFGENGSDVAVEQL